MIARLFDHTVNLHRPNEARDEYGGTTTTYTAVITGTEPNAALVPPKRRLRGYGAGEAPAGETELYVAADADVQRRDVVEVTAGPEAGTTWRVLDVHTPRGHHTEATVEFYTGELEAAA